MSVDHVHVLYLLLAEPVSIDILIVEVLLGLVPLLLGFGVHHCKVAHLVRLLFPLVERCLDGVMFVIDHSFDLLALQLNRELLSIRCVVWRHATCFD